MNENRFMSLIGYNFKNQNLLKAALTHSSYGNDMRLEINEFNERLEFIGDAFLDAIIGVELYLRLPNESEGHLSKLRALIVCERSIASIAMGIGLGEFMNLGNGESNNGGRDKESILADCLEAVIGAVFLDGGYAAADKLVKGLFGSTVVRAIDGDLFSDYKSEVQERLQEGGKPVNIRYELEREEGPPHDRTFFVHLSCDNKIFGRGSGKTKKEAEQNAAKATLDLIKEVVDVF